MRARTIKRVWVVTTLAVALVATLVVLSAPSAMAQTGGGYDLSWNNVDGGLSTSSGGGYELAGAAGQHDTGSATGGSYALSSGFFVPVEFPFEVLPFQARLPIVLNP